LAHEEPKVLHAAFVQLLAEAVLEQVDSLPVGVLAW
jgi:hypothetical protein